MAFSRDGKGIPHPRARRKSRLRPFRRAPCPPSKPDPWFRIVGLRGFLTGCSSTTPGGRTTPECTRPTHQPRRVNPPGLVSSRDTQVTRLSGVSQQSAYTRFVACCAPSPTRLGPRLARLAGPIPRAPWHGSKVTIQSAGVNPPDAGIGRRTIPPPPMRYPVQTTSFFRFESGRRRAQWIAANAAS
jgi:hypothetical protein